MGPPPPNGSAPSPGPGPGPGPGPQSNDMYNRPGWSQPSGYGGPRPSYTPPPGSGPPANHASGNGNGPPAPGYPPHQGPYPEQYQVSSPTSLLTSVDEDLSPPLSTPLVCVRGIGGQFTSSSILIIIIITTITTTLPNYCTVFVDQCPFYGLELLLLLWHFVFLEAVIHLIISPLDYLSLSVVCFLVVKFVLFLLFPQPNTKPTNQLTEATPSTSGRAWASHSAGSAPIALLEWGAGWSWTSSPAQWQWARSASRSNAK